MIAGSNDVTQAFRPVLETAIRKGTGLKACVTIGETMQALLLTEYRHLEIADMPTPSPGPGELLIRVRACGICGSDIHGYDGSSGRRIPPLVMGHEAAGNVAAIGAGVSGFREGDRVTFDSTVYCGACFFCR